MRISYWRSDVCSSDLLVTAAVEQDVMRDQHFQVGECGTEPVGVATPVSGQRFGLWKGIDHERRTLMIAHFPLAQQPTLAVANRVQLRVQTVDRKSVV